MFRLTSCGDSIYDVPGSGGGRMRCFRSPGLLTGRGGLGCGHGRLFAARGFCRGRLLSNDRCVGAVGIPVNRVCRSDRFYRLATATPTRFAATLITGTSAGFLATLVVCGAFVAGRRSVIGLRL